MNDNLSIFITMIVLVILVVIFPLYNHFERQDNMSYNLVLKATTNFIDEVINCGYIDQEMYTKYVSEIANTGNLYDIELEAHKKIITKDTEGVGEYQDQYIVDYNYDIFDENTGKAISVIDNKAIKNGIYKLDVGDEIYVKVKNSSTTMAEAIFSTIVPTATAKNITVNYGGIIKNNAWLKAESSVVAKKLIELKYQVSGVINEDDTQSKYLYHGESNVKFKLEKEDPSKAGYTFKGWKNADDETEKIYNKGEEVSLRDSMTLVAVMETNTPKVIFNANGGTVTQAQKMVTYNQSYGTLPTPTRSGYTFDGWYTAKTGGILVTQDSTVNYAEDHTLYAHWKLEQYTITYNLNGGTNNSSNPESYTYGTTVTLKDATRSGYLFKGWYLDSAFNTKVTTISGTGTKTVYARWEKAAVAPTITLSTTQWTNQNVTATIQATIPQGYILQYKLSGGHNAGWSNNVSSGTTVNISNNNTTITARVYNASTGDLKQSEISVTNIDKTPPYTKVEKIGKFKFRFTIVDDLSGVDTSSITSNIKLHADARHNKANFQVQILSSSIGKSSYEHTFNLQNDRNYYIRYYWSMGGKTVIKDKAGNEYTITTETTTTAFTN